MKKGYKLKSFGVLVTIIVVCVVIVFNTDGGVAHDFAMTIGGSCLLFGLPFMLVCFAMDSFAKRQYKNIMEREDVQALLAKQYQAIDNLADADNFKFKE
jgi:amino acid transporter